MLNAGGTTGEGLCREAIDASVLGMGILDRDGRWLQLNPAAARLLGRDAQTLAGQPLAAAMAPADAQLAAGPLAALAAGNAAPLALEAEFVRGDGAHVRLHLDAAPMPSPEGRVVYLVAQLREADPGQARLARAEAALAALHRLQESFAHGVSHDLRAPLRAVDSFSALLASHLAEQLDDTARDYLGRIRGATARMSTLIDSLLELSRAMRAELQLGPVDLGLLVDWAHAELADADAGRRAEVVAESGLLVLGDERQLRQLLNQLLHNAWKFSRDREQVRIEVSGRRDGDRLVVAVRDYGSGFDMRYADKLFQPFQRLHGPEQAGGNGIGLAIVRCIVERHGGRAWAQSEPGAGSTFFIELPAAPDDGAGAGAADRAIR